MMEDAGDRNVLVIALVCTNEELGHFVHDAARHTGLKYGSALVRREESLANPDVVGALWSLFSVDGVAMLRRQLREGEDELGLPPSALDAPVRP